MKTIERVEDRQLCEAVDPRKHLAFVPLTALRIYDVAPLAGGRRNDPVRLQFARDDVKMVCGLAAQLLANLESAISAIL